jgi:hypothetical protein
LGRVERERVHQKQVDNRQEQSKMIWREIVRSRGIKQVKDEYKERQVSGL